MDDEILIYEEGDNCPVCESGEFEYHVVGCRCFASAPCSACTSGDLKCNNCGLEIEGGTHYAE